MKALSETWFAEGYIDFEQKKYTLLAYLQQVNATFNQNKLYPQLADVIFHYNNLLQFKHNKSFLQQQFPRRLSAVDMQRLSLLYEAMIADDEVMQELEEILQYAVAQMRNTIEGGTGIYEFVEGHLEIAPVGLMPLDHREGYFMLRDGHNTLTRVYQYRLSFFEQQEHKYRSLKTEYVDSWPHNLVNTAQSIKAELLRNRRYLPNPAVFAIGTQLTFPVEETLLPIAKRSLARYLETGAAA